MKTIIIIGITIGFWYLIGYYTTTDKYKIKRIYKIFRAVKGRISSDEPRTTMNIETLSIYNKKLMETLFYLEDGKFFLEIIGGSENIKELARTILSAEESFFGEKYHFSTANSIRIQKREENKSRLIDEIYDRQQMSKYE